MKIEVRYYSRGGATKKLAEAIARAVGVEAVGVDAPLGQRADVVFLGASVYGGRPADEVLAFVRRNARDIGKIVVFGSACTSRSTHAVVRAAAADCGVDTADMYFQCKGQFLFLNKNRPNEADCAAAAEFARSQIKALGVN